MEVVKKLVFQKYWQQVSLGIKTQKRNKHTSHSTFQLRDQVDKRIIIVISLVR